jgi:outer membrane protein
MRQHILAIATTLMMLVASPLAFAEVKIAVVDVQRALMNSEQAKVLLGKIQEEFKGEEDDIRKVQSEAAALLQRMQKDSEVMSESEKRKLQQEIEEKNNDFVYLRQKLQRQAEERQRELFTGTEAKLQKAIEALVISEDYDLIMPRGAALYVGDLYDITRKVTEKLNEMDK